MDVLYNVGCEQIHPAFCRYSKHIYYSHNMEDIVSVVGDKWLYTLAVFVGTGYRCRV